MGEAVTGGVPKTAARRWAERIDRARNAYEKANEAYDILCEIVNAPSAGSLGSFPRPASELRYGVSITDACLGWEATEALLREEEG